MTHFGLFAVVFTPLLVLLLMPFARLRPLAVRLTPYTALPALVLSLSVREDFTLHVSWLLLGTDVGIDLVARVFMFFSAWVWLAAGFFARRYVKGLLRHRFFLFYLVALSGNLGVIIAQDIVTFLLFFSMMSLASYALIVHRQNAEAIRAARVYITLVILGEMVLFAGAVLAYHVTGTITLAAMTDALTGAAQRDLVMLLFFVGFGIKAGLVPLHIWLPLAHPAAPTPASAVLSAAMIKAGFLGWLRFLPVGKVGLPTWGLWCVILGLIAAFYGVLFGLPQKNPKAILAYSSISQMGFLTLILGMGMASPATWPLALTALLIYAMHHALAKGALFLSVGVSLEGMAQRWQRVLLGLGLIIPALALAGAPWTSGAIAKGALKQALYETEALQGDWLIWLISFGAVGTSLLMARFLYVLWPRHFRASASVEPALWVPWALVVVSVVLVPWLTPWPELRHAALAASQASLVWSSLWPVALAAALAYAFYHWRLASPYRLAFNPPAGDLVVPVVGLLSLLLRSSQAFRAVVFRKWQTLVDRSARLLQGPGAYAQIVNRLEAMLTNWTSGGFWVVLLGVLVFVALWLAS